MVGGGEVGRVHGGMGGVHEVQVVKGGELVVVAVQVVQVSEQITNIPSNKFARTNFCLSSL